MYSDPDMVNNLDNQLRRILQTELRRKLKGRILLYSFARDEYILICNAQSSSVNGRSQRAQYKRCWRWADPIKPLPQLHRYHSLPTDASRRTTTAISACLLLAPPFRADLSRLLKFTASSKSCDFQPALVLPVRFCPDAMQQAASPMAAAMAAGSGTPHSRKRARSRLSIGGADACEGRFAQRRALTSVGPSGAFLLQLRDETFSTPVRNVAAAAAGTSALTAERPPTPEGRRVSLEAQFAEVASTVAPVTVQPTADEDATTRRLSKLLARLSSELGAELTFGRVVATSTFGDIVTATTASGEKAIVKFSQHQVWSTWDGNRGDNLEMLRKESRSLEYLNTLPGSERHVVRLIHPICEFEAEDKEGKEVKMGAIVMEKGSWDVGNYVKSKLAEGTKAARVEAAHAFTAWEDSIGWLHSHGILHLDIKANNAVGFEDGSVKLIDFAGMLTRADMAGDPAEIAALHNKDLTWNREELKRRGTTFVSAGFYRQPAKVRQGVLDYSADWWSMAISKMELLQALPSNVDEQKVGKVIWLSLNAGQLDGALRARVAGALCESDPFCDEVNAWVHSIMCNLHGRPAGVEYIKEAQRVLYLGWETMYDMEA